MKIAQVRYIFKFEEEKKIFEYKLDFQESDYLYIGKKDKAYPEWTKLESNKCSNCPLKTSDCEYCPIAKNLSDFVTDIKSMLSYEKVTMVVSVAERNYVKKTDLQSGLFSMFGLVMAASECPHMQFLRPLARFHLPFSSVNETIFRVSSMYLLGRYVDSKINKSTKVDLDSLQEKYKAIEQVNSGMLARIRALEKGDAGKNAIVALNIFAQMFEMEFFSDNSVIDKFY